jgi:hypothetical protein
MQPLAEEIIAAAVTSLGGLRAKALVALWEALPGERARLVTTSRCRERCASG